MRVKRANTADELRALEEEAGVDWGGGGASTGGGGGYLALQLAARFSNEHEH